MKLIDLLVQELPKHGGWPTGVRYISSHADGSFYRDGGRWVGGFYGFKPSDSWRNGMPSTYTNKVTREQYEAALAASHQPAWNGEGLPPVGTECEIENHNGWSKIRINAYADGCAFITWLSGPYSGGDLVRGGFEMRNLRPIRTEAERKREHAITQMMQCSAVLVEATAGLIYDAIGAGKIPGVKLDDIR